MQRAVASGTIVASLFPERVRDQMYAENEAKTNNTKNNKQGGGGTGTDPGSVFSSQNHQDENKITTAPRAIADVYENTTIFFADLAGFTKWSSTRQPSHVFELLEEVRLQVVCDLFIRNTGHFICKRSYKTQNVIRF